MFFKLRALKDFANFRGNTCVGASLLEKQNAFQLPLFFFYLFSTLPETKNSKQKYILQTFEQLIHFGYLLL